MNRKKNQPEVVRRTREIISGRRYFDLNLVAVLLLLLAFGLVMLYSTSSYVANISFGDDMYYFRRQLIFCVISLVVAFVVSRIDYHVYMKIPVIIYVVAAFLMLLVRTPLGVTVNGAKRWLRLGPLQFQPSELAKLAAILVLPVLVVNMGKQISTLRGMATVVLVGGMLALMIFLFTDNLSTALIVLGITIGVIFIAHPKTAGFIGGAVAVVAAAAVTISTLVVTMESSNNFRLQRILVWLHPEDYIEGDGYQVMQALYAIGSGGIFGKGLGNSVQKLGWVPEAQNDMIFSIICEELGIFGGVLVMLLFAYLLYRLFFIAQNASDLYGALIVTGIFIHIALQVILNISVVLNLIPTTGITLPFFSYGGTSVIFLMIEMGIALSVSRGIRFKDDSSEST